MKRVGAGKLVLRHVKQASVDQTERRFQKPSGVMLLQKVMELFKRCSQFHKLSLSLNEDIELG